MNEAADAASNVSAIVLLSLWWAFLSALDLLSTQRGSTPARPAAAAEDPDPRFAALRRLDPGFDAATFLKGARRAYEAVLQAYALADLQTLRTLLAPDVLAAFAEACAGRGERRETLELTVVGIDSAEIADIEITAGTIEITVRFRAEIVSAERSATGDVIAGDPAAVRGTADLWTFSRPVPSDGAAWVVVATDEG